MNRLGEHRGAAARDLEQVFNQGTATGLPDGQFLHRFVAGRDESAFSALVSRHGPMVLGVCRRVLGPGPDADDAFQATFLVLLRRASTLHNADSLGPWLHGVAWRVATRARAGNARRRLEERKAAAIRPERTEAACPADRRELDAVVDEEINRLPENHRRPIVLCYLEGLTQDAAARQLGWNTGVLRGRLDRARLRLRSRLARRGLAPAATFAIAGWLESLAQAEVTPALLDATAGIACRELTVANVAGTVAAASAVALASEFMRRQLLGRAALIAALLAGGGLALAATVTTRTIPNPISSAQPKPSPSSAPTKFRMNQPDQKTIEFRAVDRITRKPLPAVRLTVVAGTTQIADGVTDQTGAMAAVYPSPRPNRMRISARKDGFVPMVVWLRHPEHDEDFPSTFTLVMFPATAIGGLVKDEDGQPVAGATVSPNMNMNLGETHNAVEIRLGENALTDSHGHWSCPSIPPEFGPTQLAGLRIHHPDFEPSAIHADELQAAIGPTGAAVLRRGIVIAGRVVDRQGHPIPGARVGAGRDWFGSDPPIVNTDANGRFRLGHLQPRQTVITVSASGHASQAIEVDARAGLSPVELKLGTPRTIQGRVVDRDGKSLSGIRLSLVFWKGFHTLDWKAETGPDGRFRWDEAPPEEVWLSVFGHGFIGLQNRVVKANEAETIITLARTLRVTGTVVDVRTRKPIESFTLTPGTDVSYGSAMYWDQSRSKRHNGGRYEVRFAGPANQGHLLKIEANGFNLAISRPIADVDEVAEFDFELVPANSSRK
jgi:RNA polymerase sigma factor (sigma-70 family)